MTDYRVFYTMTAHFETIIEADSEEEAIAIVESDEYDMSDEPNEWSDFKICDADEVEEVGKYGFLCENPNNPDYPAYGIEYSEDEDGDDIYSVQWYPNKESRDAQVEIDKENGFTFPREEA